ncbi:MAG: hypothetical protein WB523_15265 [Candidatus Sulfotelmatobacter sp.]
MRIFRLFPLSLLMVAATVAAQSAPQKSSDPVQSTNPGTLNIHAGPRLEQFGLPPTSAFDFDGQLQTDTLCYSMRSYKVARDNSQSDSTHPVGYSTCQPATRFRTHTIEGVIPPTQP